MAHVIQYHVFSGVALQSASVFVQVFDAGTGAPVQLWWDRLETDPLPSHEFAVQNGFFRVYARPGRYNIRAFNDRGDEAWYKDVDVAGWML
ncbi:hypothetical protein [Teredinibacter turnerae]|uniref:hypothetical protein n=1 Tax=Teredinibacter turnerae TaxID=2426 RepID=UPI0030D2127D